ncbi:MAG: hypothetical protein OXN92_01135 [Gammaproteobacteria bacterium]|nr:hypothetical protein [Gammaproteobacteria bacterium]
MIEYRRPAFTVAVCLMATACVHGPDIRTFPPAIGPAGISALLHVGNDSLRVEVLSVERDALLVLVDDSARGRLAGTLARVPFTAIRRGEFAHAGNVPSPIGAESYDVDHFLDGGRKGGEQPEAHVGSGDDIAADPEIRERLRLLSRYPQGVDDPLLARLEATYGEVETLAPGSDP